MPLGVTLLCARLSTKTQPLPLIVLTASSASVFVPRRKLVTPSILPETSRRSLFPYARINPFPSGQIVRSTCGSGLDLSLDQRLGSWRQHSRIVHRSVVASTAVTGFVVSTTTHGMPCNSVTNRNRAAFLSCGALSLTCSWSQATLCAAVALAESAIIKAIFVSLVPVGFAQGLQLFFWTRIVEKRITTQMVRPSLRVVRRTGIRWHQRDSCADVFLLMQGMLQFEMRDDRILWPCACPYPHRNRRLPRLVSVCSCSSLIPFRAASAYVPTPWDFRSLWGHGLLLHLGFPARRDLQSSADQFEVLCWPRLPEAGCCL